MLKKKNKKRDILQKRGDGKSRISALRLFITLIWERWLQYDKEYYDVDSWQGHANAEPGVSQQFMGNVTMQQQKIYGLTTP